MSDRNDEILYQVRDVCKMTGVTRKTLYFYDKTGLLKPVSRYGSQSFKQYDMDAVRRLKQILAYRECGLTLNEIMQIMDDPGCDRMNVYQSAMARMIENRQQTEEQLEKLELLMNTDRRGV